MASSARRTELESSPTRLGWCRGDETVEGWVLDSASSLVLHAAEGQGCFAPRPTLFFNDKPLKSSTLPIKTPTLPSTPAQCTKEQCSDQHNQSDPVHDDPSCTSRDPVTTDAAPLVQPPRKKRRKKNRKALNHGEVKLAEYHASVRQFLIETSKRLITKFPMLLDGRHFQSLNLGDCPLPTNVEELALDFAKLCDSVAFEKPNTALDLQVYDHIEIATNTPNKIEFTMRDVVNRIVSNSNKLRVADIDGTPHVIPKDARFICADLRVGAQLLAKLETKFGLIVLDPPWTNKSVQRGSKYGFLSENDFCKIPITRLSKRGTLVACWITNNPSHQQSLKEVLFPSWGLKVVAEWQWLKVDETGTVTFPLDSTHKKPYEVIVIGVVGDCVKPLPPRAVIVSVPCKQHSRKPSLEQCLVPYCAPGTKKLEIFARNLLPTWTSWGNEVLKFQQVGVHGLCRMHDCSCSHD
eukprot:m.158836 g.158836  ORF g.158836 m.158836 type:complete len:465 (-) comp31110_c0_seq2:101-1495(-)